MQNNFPHHKQLFWSCFKAKENDKTSSDPTKQNNNEKEDYL